MWFEVEDFRALSRQLGQSGIEAGGIAQGGVDAMSPPAATSPAGMAFSLGLGTAQGNWASAPVTLSSDATGLDNHTQTSLDVLQSQDNANGHLFGTDRPIDPSSTTGTPAPTTPASELLDPTSIDEEAKAQAEQMLEGDQTSQMMQQMLTTGLQTGVQMATQLGQALGQIPSKLGEAVGQLGQQASQLASKVAETAADAAADDLTDSLDLSNTPISTSPAFPGGPATGPGADPGTTTPAGLEAPVTPMNTSSALQASALSAPSTSTSPSSSYSRMPMMPMMPMMPHGNNGGNGNTLKRDPEIFPEGTLYEPPEGVEQTFGANPAIESDEPPFGETA